MRSFLKLRNVFFQILFKHFSFQIDDTVNCGIFIDETRKGEWGYLGRGFSGFVTTSCIFNVHHIRRAKEK